MKKIKTILVDDEESARDVLENLLHRFCPDIELVAKCENVLQAIDVIRREEPQLVFLDIEMPEYSGFEIISFFKKIDFNIIFVTAYDQYAVRAFEVAAVDYLLKPVDINRLKKSVARVKQLNVEQHAQRLSLLEATLKNPKVNNIAVSERGRQYILPLSTIIAIEAQESYCVIHTTSKKYTVSKNLKHFETIFSDNASFIRVHKSWLIAKAHILNYSKSSLVISLTNGLSAKLSKYKKAEFEAAILI